MLAEDLPKRPAGKSLGLLTGGLFGEEQHKTPCPAYTIPTASTKWRYRCRSPIISKTKPFFPMWIQQKPGTPAPLDELQGRTVGLKFECNHCNTEVFTDLLGVPAPDLLANSMEDDGQFETEEIKCPGCDMTHSLTVRSTFEGVQFDVSEVKPDSVSYQVAEPEA